MLVQGMSWSALRDDCDMFNIDSGECACCSGFILYSVIMFCLLFLALAYNFSAKCSSSIFILFATPSYPYSSSQTPHSSLYLLPISISSLSALFPSQ